MPSATGAVNMSGRLIIDREVTCNRTDNKIDVEKRRMKTMRKKPAVLMILDGYGLNEKKEGNAVAEAKTPVMDKLMEECPFVKGNASGMAVGLPDGQMGNSEVGHLNMGAGRIVMIN